MITGGTENTSSAGATLLGSFSGATGTIYDRGFEWGTSPSLQGAKSESLGSITGASGSFSVALGSLTAGTTYYYRAWVRLQDAQGGIGAPIYGEIRSFTTVASDLAGLQYLGGYEIPALSLVSTEAATDSGPETFYESGSPTNWYKYATTNANRMVVTHTYSYGGKEYCNYTVLVDKTKKAPLWNAFEMSEEYLGGNNGQSGSWTKDPALDDDWQQSSSNGTYSRGHFCASNYRKISKTANKQTYYLTNQALQVQDGFNGSLWAQLEQYVVKNAPTSATKKLYVVVGVLYEGSATLNGVPVPSHFYKCLMLCTFNASGVMTAASGCAYLFANKAYDDNNYSAGLTSIDAVETRSGFNFFAAVPESLQNSAEAHTSALW